MRQPNVGIASGHRLGNPAAQYPSAHSCMHLRHCVKVLYAAVTGLIMIKFTKAAWMFVAASPWRHLSFDLVLSNIRCHARLEWKKRLLWWKPAILKTGLLRGIVGKWWCNIPSYRNSSHYVSMLFPVFFVLSLFNSLFVSNLPSRVRSPADMFIYFYFYGQLGNYTF